ncbi:hypothetical protein PL85_15025 [Vibrio anguillarum]|nr:MULTISPECIES: hypothetical protein [Vibrio]MBF4232017.1 hypothetical protein [Vibrio anguillarum]MBF4247597.1 hypothetical protein [Vibrio anguillarum]MBF4269691.1 hypothetical protein [Vibrio anguillarum]MBF4283634.1 hypothetical protein [Vibrio anguillarum]MBF4290131.1 hypothetical protein [Vibrio anguillarum]
MDVNAKRVDSPTYKIMMYLNKYEPELLDNEKIQFLFKNLQTNFKKLFYTIAHINKVQKDEDFIKEYNQTSVVSISSVEYCYYKISTIWDIAYQIADKLIFPNKKSGDKYEYLEKKFEGYADNFDALQLGWYRDLNKVRNKIVHGGITVNPFYVNDDEVKNRICFQAYDFNLDDLIQPHYMYSNECNNNINFADNYFAFHTHLLYSYLCDFFEFILIELNKDKNHDREKLSLDELPYELFERGQKTWLLSEVDTFTEITKEMIALQLADGHLNNINKVSIQDIEQFYDYFPFTMMKRISDGDFVLAANES